MKIEKINDNQIKFILSYEDLQHWNIKLTELTYGSERTQEMFHEMMELASNECDFQVDNSPLLIEAIPQAQGSITIIVTKVASNSDVEEKYNLPPLSKLVERFKKNGFLDLNRETAKATPTQKQSTEVTNISVFLFENLDAVIDASARVSSLYWGENALYKLHGGFYLVLNHDQNSAKLNNIDLESVLTEYGQKCVASNISEYHLMEHGEVIIAHGAIHSLSKV